jgi:hypothetical protein
LLCAEAFYDKKGYEALELALIWNEVLVKPKNIARHPVIGIYFAK